MKWSPCRADKLSFRGFSRAPLRFCEALTSTSLCHTRLSTRTITTHPLQIPARCSRSTYHRIEASAGAFGDGTDAVTAASPGRCAPLRSADPRSRSLSRPRPSCPPSHSVSHRATTCAMARFTRSLVPSSTVWALHRSRGHGSPKLTSRAVKFDTEQLPSILNALTTENQGQKLTLEVAVRIAVIVVARENIHSD